VFVTFYPFWDQLILSISPRNEALKAGFRFYTLFPTLEAYRNALGSNEIIRSFGNTVVRVVLGTLVSVGLAALTAYPLTKREMPFSRLITFFFLFTMYFGGGLIPTYLLIKDLGLMNRIWALILPGAVSAYNLIVMRSFIDTLPQSLEESARIDGASYFTIWRRIVLPLSKPVLATITLWVAVGHWNAYFDAMIYMHDRSKYTLPVVLRRILLENQLERFLPVGSAALLAQVVPTPETTKAAIVMISTIPIICVYPFLQKYFTKGVLLGAVKG
jgi:putative aldouronate transport system permease protein